MDPTRLTELFSRYQNLELVLDSLPDAVIVHDVDRRITFVNRAAERLVGLSRAEIIGRDCWTVLKGGFCGSRCAFCDQCVPDFELEQYPLVVTSHRGERRRVEMTVVPMRDDESEIVGVLAYARDVTEVVELRRAMQQERSFQGLVGEHHLMQEVYQTIREVAPTDVPVLVSGESGTGKELVARAVHEESERAGKPFVAVNCAALPENLLESELFGHVRGAFTGAVKDKKGRFALADGGTLFLDEVGELPLSMQVKLLRVLETQRFEPVGGERSVAVDVRIISATNRDLRSRVADGAFRQDLYFRLAVVPITLPPLRQRRTDVLALADHFLARFSAQRDASPPALSERALERLLDHDWPGNVRELMNALQYALVKSPGDVIDARHLPAEVGAANGAPPPQPPPQPPLLPQSQPTRDTVAGRVDAAHPPPPDTDPPQSPPAARVGRKPKLTPAQVEAALAEAGGNRAKAARLLGVGRSTLYRHLPPDAPHRG
jgi:PAS domain S-box-containing protein